jgi:hypothetical protein
MNRCKRTITLLLGVCLALGALPACEGTKSQADTSEDDDKSDKGKKKKKKDKGDKGKSDKKDEAKKEAVLDRLKTFKASKPGHEPYDSILLTNRAHEAKLDDVSGEPRPLPPTYTDVLIEDMRRVGELKLSMGKIEAPLTRAQLEQLVAFYAATDAGKIPGYRPFTHKEFITGLSEDDRKRLVDELEAHLKNGYAAAVLVPEHERDK